MAARATRYAAAESHASRDLCPSLRPPNGWRWISDTEAPWGRGRHWWFDKHFGHRKT